MGQRLALQQASLSLRSGAMPELRQRHADDAAGAAAADNRHPPPRPEGEDGVGYLVGLLICCLPLANVISVDVAPAQTALLLFSRGCLALLLVRLFYLSQFDRSRGFEGVILVDGDCAMCSGFATFMSGCDERGAWFFETQQSATGRALLEEHKQPVDLSTIVTIERVGKRTSCHVRSGSVLRACFWAGGWLRPACLFLLVPAFVRDAVYKVIAANRIRIFGKTENCVLPPKVVRARMRRKPAWVRIVPEDEEPQENT